MVLAQGNVGGGVHIDGRREGRNENSAALPVKMLVTGLALFVDHVADLDEGGLLLIIAESKSRNIGEDYSPDSFRHQVVMNLVGDVRDAGPGAEQDGGDERLLVPEGGRLEPSLEVVDKVLGEGVAHDDESVFHTGVTIPERRKGEAGNSDLRDLVAVRGNVIEI